MPLPQKRLIPGILLLLMLAALASPPLWWSDGDPDSPDNKPVLTDAPPNHQGPANIGQTKHMVSQALKALEVSSPSIAIQIRNDLDETHPGLLDSPSDKTPEWIAKQKAPLLIGQLKALAHHFYRRLNEANSEWVLQQIQLNHNSTAIEGAHYWHVTDNADYQAGYYPWNPATPSDQNKSIATTGQLKAVFSLRFESLLTYTPVPTLPEVNQDPDGDGLTTEYEINNGLNPNNADTDGDGILDGVDSEPNPQFITLTEATVIHLWSPL